MKYLVTILACLYLVTPQANAGVVDVNKLSKKKQTPQGLYLTAVEAYKLVESNRDKVLFLDVRTQPELEFVGSASDIDANIPYLTNDLTSFDKEKKHFKKEANSNFLPDVNKKVEDKGLGKDATIVLMCRSGSRSAKAAALLFKAGYKNVYSVVDGFEGDKEKSGLKKGQRTVNGWKNAGLPWTYILDESKMYFD